MVVILAIISKLHFKQLQARRELVEAYKEIHLHL